tara:strand:+ start:859 stop:1116 length:258 start_codon:yes stop_codon:yes gene_type:complete
VAQEKIGSQFPRQAQGENPDRGKPNMGVIVQVSGLLQLFGSGNKASNAGLAVAGACPVVFEPSLGLQRVYSALQASLIILPNSWS